MSLFLKLSTLSLKCSFSMINKFIRIYATLKCSKNHITKHRICKLHLNKQDVLLNPITHGFKSLHELTGYAK